MGVRGFSAALPLKPCYVNTFRTPEVVEFAVSPQVGQAVLAFARSCLGSGLGSARAGRRAPPAPPAKLSPSKGMAPPIFPARQKLPGEIRRSDLSCQIPEAYKDGIAR